MPTLNWWTRAVGIYAANCVIREKQMSPEHTLSGQEIEMKPADVLARERGE